jgi:hypothetical protein
MSPRYITKSRFKTATECPTKLFYINKTKEYANLMSDNVFLESLADGGYQIGVLAKCLYPDGIEIEGKEHSKVIAETLEHLKKENVVLFEAAICYQDFFIRIDILVKKGNDFEIHEVKAKSYDPMDPGIEKKRGNGLASGMLPYIQDVAFQTWVLRKAFPHVSIKSFLLMTDKSKDSKYDGMNQMFKISSGRKIIELVPTTINKVDLAKSILVNVAIDQYVEYVLKEPLEIPQGPMYFESAILDWAKHYKDDQKIKPIIGMHCNKCEFESNENSQLKSGFHECWKEAAGLTDKDFKEGTVLDLFNFRKKEDLIRKGVYKIRKVDRNLVGEFEDNPDINGLTSQQRQWLQISGIPKDYDLGGFFFYTEFVAKEMSSWKYPLHFIDFETSAVALPFYEGLHPYEQVAFQFSHHVMEKDGSIRHANQFLCVEPGEFPNYKLVRELKKSLEKDEGTIFMWSSYENTILTTIGRQLKEDKRKPDDADALLDFIQAVTKDGARNMVDLCKISEKSFYHPDTKGSSSIKKVLPALFKVSSHLISKYSEPIYGSPQGIESKNFKSDSGFIWIDKNDENHDPYKKLRVIAEDLLPDAIDETEEGKASIIAEGGAAATAYGRLQYEDLSKDARERIKTALYRYCELDTLAMVMVVEAWKAFINE